MIEGAGRFGYIDHSGNFIIQPRFLDGDSFHEGMARVIVEGPCTYFRIPEETLSLDFGIVPRGTDTKEQLPLVQVHLYRRVRSTHLDCPL